MLHKSSVSDPFRWLEDRASPATEGWIRDQQGRWTQYLSECPSLDAIRPYVHTYLGATVVDQPVKLPGKYLFRRRDAGQEMGCILVTRRGGQEERVLLDPSSFDPSTSAAIHRVSPNGSLVACELRQGGEDSKAIRIVDIDTGYQYPDQVESGRIRGFAFKPDNTGYYYCREGSSIDSRHSITLHTFHQPTDDRVLFRAECTPQSGLVLLADGVHLGALLIYLKGKDLCEDFWIARHESPMDWHLVFTGRALPFSPLLRWGRILAISFEHAPNGRLVEMARDGCESRQIIGEQATPLEQVSFAGNRIFATVSNCTAIRSWNFDGREERVIHAPPQTTISILPNYSDADVLFYSLESFTLPVTVLEFDIKLGMSRLWHESAISHPSIRVSIQHKTFNAKDGTPIPVTTVRSLRSRRDGLSPTIMTSYGGFGVSATPRFSAFVSIMIELGFTFALPHIRGGGDFGTEWHEAGRGRNRQTSIDDFCSAADWLCRSRVTSPGNLAIFGGSNSGLLVGAAMTQQPELFRAVLCIAPLLDMVNYERLGCTPSWRIEFGTADDPGDLAALLAYSPYHRIMENTDYPSVLFVTGDRDERCNPAHVRKMAALLLARPAQNNPVLVDYSANRGHVPALPLSVREEALTARIAFLCRELGVQCNPGGIYDAVHL
jgi:prolyl oligopeptidase